MQKNIIRIYRNWIIRVFILNNNIIFTTCSQVTSKRISIDMHMVWVDIIFSKNPSNTLPVKKMHKSFTRNIPMYMYSFVKSKTLFPVRCLSVIIVCIFRWIRAIREIPVVRQKTMSKSEGKNDIPLGRWWGNDVGEKEKVIRITRFARRYNIKNPLERIT